MTEKLIRKVWIAVSAAALWGCGGASSYTAVDGVMLGTTLHITADVQGVSPQELYAAVMELDREAKASMSIFDPSSLLSRLNRNETDSVDRHIAFNLHLADSIGALSGGRYDVTVKPLVEAWGFAGRQAERHPDVDSILAFVGREKVRVEEGRLVKADPRVQLDFNSIAKGYTVDLLARLVESFGARNYIVDIGGEVRCKGVNRQGGPWRIGIETPFDGNMSDGEYVQKRIRLTDGGLATSGNYRRFYLDADGNKVAHTIDPRTGRSAVSRLLSVTVAAPTCAEADALGTMFLAMGADDALKAVRTMPDVKAYFILADGTDGYEEYISPAMEAMIMVVATVVAPVMPVARYTATSRRLTLPTPSALHITSSSSAFRPTFSLPPMIAVVAGTAPSARTISSTLCANSTFCGYGIPWLRMVDSSATTGLPASMAS